MSTLVERLSKYLGLPATPDDLFLWNINDSPTDWGQPGRALGDLIWEAKPGLVFADPLSAVHPAVEKSNGDATTYYQMLRKLIRDRGCSIVNLHHRKKPPPPRPGQPAVQSLEDAPSPQAWFNDARGASVLVNGTDVRWGVDIPGRSGVSGDIALVTRGYSRVRGEIPTMHLIRDADTDGEPLGCRRATGVQLLHNQEQEAVFNKLPERVTFKEAKFAYGKGDQATLDFLKKCMSKDILKKTSKGVYEKVRSGVTGVGR